MHIRHKHYMFLNRYRYVAISALILIALGFLFSSENKAHTLLSHNLLHPQKEISKIFLEGEYIDYLEFVQGQPKGKKLEWKQFQKIHELGKSVSSVLENSNLRDHLLEGVAILEISQKSGVEKCFCKLKESDLLEKDESIFQAAFFLLLVRIAENSPDLLTKEVYLNLIRLKKSALLIKKEGYKAAFAHYKGKLAGLLELDMDSVLHSHLLQVALEKEIYSVEDILKVKEALLKLPFEKICEIIHDERVGADPL